LPEQGMSRSKQVFALVLTVVCVTWYYHLLDQGSPSEYRITQTGAAVASQTGTPETAVAKVLPLPTVAPTISAKAVTAANAIPSVQSSPNAAAVMTVSTAIPRTCFMELCNLHDGQAPRLWVMEHTDGAGHRMKNILDGLAVAQTVGMNFGGVVSLKHPLTDQHVDFKKLALGFFGGVTDNGGLFYYNESGPPKWFAKVNDPRELLSKMSSFPAGAFVYMPSANDWTNLNGKASEVYPSKLRAGFAHPFASRPLNFAPGRPTVAMHLRRADLPKGNFRATPNEYYYRLADLIRAQLPSPDIHIWAALKNIPADPQDYWSPVDFDGFKERGMSVHLDKGQEDHEDVLVAWAHMVRADVYVMSQSSFAYVPAVLNCRCVIFPGSIGKHLDNWMDGKDVERGSFNDDFMACMQRAKEGRPC